MPMFDENHVKIENCLVVWDGITRPDDTEDGGKKWNLKVLANPGNPDVQLLDQLAQRELQLGEFRGVLPNGGTMPIGQAGPQEFNGQYPGWAVFKASTWITPQVFDEQGNRLDPMQYGNKFYGGQIVDLLVHCKTFNNKSKGVAARLDGVLIRVSQNAPMQNFGGGGIDAAAAFVPAGGQPQQQAPAQPQQQWGGQPQQQAPAQPQQQWGGQPQQQAPAQQPQQQQWGGQPQQQAPAQQAPQQAHNWLPNQ